MAASFLNYLFTCKNWLVVIRKKTPCIYGSERMLLFATVLALLQYSIACLARKGVGGERTWWRRSTRNVTPRVADDDCATAATRRMMTMTPTSDLATALSAAMVEWRRRRDRDAPRAPATDGGPAARRRRRALDLRAWCADAIDQATYCTARMCVIDRRPYLALLEGALIEPAGRRTYVHAGRWPRYGYGRTACCRMKNSLLGQN